ncbi:MAG: COX15/CtaA family protein [Rickettsiaceae bacterium H1]|nr:COX15/CtaA family protein [Rickettsiaceae bacterium H1]
MNSVKLWIISCSILVIIIVWIGGITRLTNSGLSITEWKPITGIIPPLTKQEWIKEKIKYEKTPEYKKVNFDISMSEFKTIYIIEYIHRIFARLIGLVFLLPFIYFFITKKLKGRTIILMLIALTIGILQGFMGWYMVKSGLINQPYVSQYRLSAHLLLATIIFSILLWEGFHKNENQSTITHGQKIFLALTIGLVTLQITIGALVSGLKAGMINNTFPLTDGKLIPKGLFSISPYWKNFFENITTVQFLHRITGLIILINMVIISYSQKNKITAILLTTTTIQVLLGIITLIYQVPIIAASLHQVTAFIVLSITIFYYKNTRIRTSI